MDTLRIFLNSMSPAEQAAFADRAGTTIGFLRKALSINQKLGEGLCIRLVAASGGQIQPEQLRPDVAWHVIRGAAPPSRDIDHYCAKTAKTAEKLAALRQAGLTGAEIARRTGVPQPTISRIERGVHLHPKELAVRAIDALYAAVISHAA